MLNKITKSFLLLMFFGLLLVGCKNNSGTVLDMNKEETKQNDLEKQLDEFSCFSFCNENMKKICPDYNASTCENDCMTKWPDTIRNCMLTAESCDQISQSEPYCKEKLDKDLIPEPEEENVAPGCPGACSKYKICAGFTDDATEEDKQYAYYESCMEICGS